MGAYLTKPMEPKTFLKSLSISHITLVAALLFFGAIAYFQSNGISTKTDTNEILLYLVPVTALLGYFGSNYFFKKRINKVNIADALEVKLKQYQKACMLKYILIDAPAILGLLAFQITANALPLLIAVCLVLYLISQRPTKDDVIKNIPLTDAEKQLLG